MAVGLQQVLGRVLLEISAMFAILYESFMSPWTSNPPRSMFLSFSFLFFFPFSLFPIFVVVFFFAALSSDQYDIDAVVVFRSVMER